MKIIDTHAHLDHIENLENVLSCASESGVEKIIAVSVDLASCQKTLEIQKKYTSPEIFIALGIHPGNIKTDEIDETLEFIRAHYSQAIAIGEIGLDFWYKWVRKDKEKKDEQREINRSRL